MNESNARRSGMNRRAFLASTAAAATAMTVGQKAAFGAEEIKFWDMVWGTGATYTAAAKELVGSYQPSGDNLGVRYQSIPWANWYQTFTSAAASRTTPAVSSGAAFLPFYFIEQGVIAPADDVVAGFDKSGTNDFLPGVLDAMKTDKGYAAMPWSMDLRVIWVRKSLLEKAGVEAPTDWQSFIKVGEALKKIDVVGLGLADGSTTTDGQHSVSALMINNGGGLFATDGTLDCVTDRNIETLDFLNELVRKGIIDPYAASYTSDNVTRDWLSGRVGMGFGQTGLDKNFPADQRSDLTVISPIKSTRGDKGTVYYINPLMMFKTTASQPSSEAFLTWYLDNMKVFWEKGVAIDVPVRKSIAELPNLKQNANLQKSIAEWQPVGKTIGAQAPRPFGALNAVDGGGAGAAFIQQIIEGKTASKQILETLQTALEKVVK
ncbi:ABC transporter substrate-binding protein [Kaistia algarum]|uniref:ABC transporter substrate-binding protein n=1 Tax=Kaistia algarum TaxID=2083279 RepID=UPI000CE778D8|nr:extracellular solute-binding protein [Kaistia algarum]MCX5515728.1 extracellular solute-binding protein [Kaistia algarum]PPE80894.1 ABC transporter substrate-binding protein [Kaistia algarum]